MIERSLEEFDAWLTSFGEVSYDQFDIWASRIGVAAKGLFLRNRLLGAAPVVALQLMESFTPGVRALFAERRRFAIGDAHLAMAYATWYEATGRSVYLERARDFMKALERSKSPTPHGVGWGYPYEWRTAYGMQPPGTPFITVTPYAYYAALQMYGLTNDTAYRDLARSAAAFAAHDLREQTLADGSVAASYGPLDNSTVYNANAYRAALLLSASREFDEPDFERRARRNLDFVLGGQQRDGSWDYAPDSSFVDNFHTCFVLKNLYRSYLVTRDSELLRAVRDGYDYYETHLMRPNGTPVHFAKTRYPKFRYLEMYDFAEGISLGVLARQDLPGAYETARRLAEILVSQYQLPDGHFVTRVNSLRGNNRIPYLRWPQAQLFYALATLLAAEPAGGADRGTSECAV